MNELCAIAHDFTHMSCIGVLGNNEWADMLDSYCLTVSDAAWYDI